MKKSGKFIGLLVALAIIFTGYFAWSHYKTNTPTENTTVRFAYLPVVQSLPLFVAMNDGYFKDVGINVEATKLDAPNLIIDSLLQSKVDFAAAAASGIIATSDIAKPDQLKILGLVGGDNSIVNDEILVKNNSDIKSIADLKGKRLGTLSGIQFRTIATDILAQNNLEVNQDVTLVELETALQAQALASGQVDALLTIEPVGTVVKVKNIGTDLAKSPMVTYISNPWYGSAYVVRNELVQNNPELIKKVDQVLKRAVKEIINHPGEAKNNLKNYTSLDDSIIPHLPLPTYKIGNDITASDTSSLQQFFDIFRTYGVINTNANAKKLIWNN